MKKVKGFMINGVQSTGQTIQKEWNGSTLQASVNRYSFREIIPSLTSILSPSIEIYATSEKQAWEELERLINTFKQKTGVDL